MGPSSREAQMHTTLAERILSIRPAENGYRSVETVFAIAYNKTNLTVTLLHGKLTENVLSGDKTFTTHLEDIPLLEGKEF